MNMYRWFIVLYSIGFFIAVFPFVVAIILQNNFLHVDYKSLTENWILYFGIGSALMGGGVGLGVGHLVYRKKDSEKNE